MGERLKSWFAGATEASASMRRRDWIESLALTLAIVLLLRLAQPEDPLAVKGPFPWPWLGPVLVALRYGVLPGVGAAGMLLLVWFAFQRAVDFHPIDFPGTYFFGGLVLVMICGQYGDHWLTRLRRLDNSNRYLDDRLTRVTGLFHLLTLSHEKLEQELLARPATLCDTLAGLRRLVARQAGSERFPAAQPFMELVAQHCQIESAALFVRDGADDRRIAAIGESVQLERNDPMVRLALEHGGLAHLQSLASAPTVQESRYLVVAPVGAAGETEGLLAVTRMPFLALNRDNLQLLNVMISYYAEHTAEAPLQGRLAAAFPACPEEFLDELVRLWRLQRRFGIVSAITRLTLLGGEPHDDMFALLRRVKRELDLAWEIRLDDGVHHAVLMPLSGQAAVDGYLARLDSLVRQQCGRPLEELAAVRWFTLDQMDVETLLHAVEGTHAG